MKRNKGPSRRIKKGNRRARTRTKNKNKNKNTPAFSPISPSLQRPPVISIHPSVSAAVNYFKQITVDAEINYEICATITPTSAGWMLKLHHKGLHSGDITEGRDSCTYERHERIILHNHPDKYYPSVEDIEKVINNKEGNMMIRESYIACKFGIWRFIVEENNKFPLDSFMLVRDEATEILDEFYHNTGRGREFNPDAVDYLCKEISELYGGIRVDFYIGNSYQDEVRF